LTTVAAVVEELGKLGGGVDAEGLVVTGRATAC
jgi:hypothetical protein